MPALQSDALTAIEENLNILEEEPATLNVYQRERLRDVYRRLQVLDALLPDETYDPNPWKYRNLSGKQS